MWKQDGAVKYWAPATQDAGANPADKDNSLTFEEQAQAILDEMNGDKKETTKEETPNLFRLTPVYFRITSCYLQIIQSVQTDAGYR